MTYHDSFQHVIKRYSRKLMLIKLDKNVRCKCHLPGSNDPDPACPKCLGTGYRIKIYEINGAPQTSTNPATFRQTNQIAIITYFYLLDDVAIDRDDLIVYDDQAFIIENTARNVGFNARFCYTKAAGIPKRLDNNIFWINYHNIIGS